MAKKLKVAILGFGPFGYEAAVLLYGIADDMCVMYRKGQHIEQFLRDRRVENILELKEDIDAETINEVLVELGIIPEPDNGNGSDAEAKSRPKTQIDLFVVDMPHPTALNAHNAHIVTKVSGYGGTVIAAAPTPADVEDLKKAGADLVICAPVEAARKYFYTFLHPGIELIIQISPNLFFARIATPDTTNGTIIGDLKKESGVVVNFVIQSTPVTRGKTKKIEGYKDAEMISPGPGYEIAEQDTAIGVMGTMEQIEKLAELLE